jgi:hypothetical protein
MSKFIESSASRESSVEIMEAILKVAGGNADTADNIWGAPNSGELVAIIEIVTNNGQLDTSDFVWGESGIDRA